MTKWNQTKIVLVGQQGAGKTAVANGLMETIKSTSTMAVNQRNMTMDNEANQNGRLQEYERVHKECETHLVDASLLSVKNKLRKEEDVNSSSSNTGRNYDQGFDQGIRKGFPSSLSLLPTSHADISANISEGTSSDLCIPENDVSRSKNNQPSGITAEAAINSNQESLIDEDKQSCRISLHDFEGAAIFKAFSPALLSRYGVYLLIFDMELILSKNEVDRATCHKELKFWLNSIAMSTYNIGTRNTAPVALIGTRKDRIGRRRDHEKISRELEEKYGGSKVWGSLIRYDLMSSEDEAENENKRRNILESSWRDLHFFPYDNTEVDNLSANLLLQTIKKNIEDADSMRRDIPLVWIQMLDEIQKRNQIWLSLKEIEEIGSFVGLKVENVPEILRFMNDVGILLWIEDERLKDIIILDPIEYLVKPATMIICKHIATKDDPYETKYGKEGIRDECTEEYGEDWMRMLEFEMVSGRLARVILRTYYERDLGRTGDRMYFTGAITKIDETIERILLIMVKYGLIITFHCSTIYDKTNNDIEQVYFVPSLMLPMPSLLMEMKDSLAKLFQRLRHRYEILQSPFETSVSFSFFFHRQITGKTDESE